MSKRFLLVVPDELMAEVGAYRVSKGIRSTAEAMRELMSAALRRSKRRAELLTEHARSVPLEETIKDQLDLWEAQQAAPSSEAPKARDRPRSLMDTLQVGPVEAKPGSRLKKRGK